MDRRAFIAASSALPLAAFAANVRAHGNDPHRAWLESWRNNDLAWIATEEGSAEGKALWSERQRLEALITKTPATTADGALAQLEWLIADSSPQDYCCPIHLETLTAAATALKEVV